MRSRFYDQTGRRAEWTRLMNEIVPDFIDPATDGPRAGREDEWSLVTEYRVQLARQARQWAEAERLQRKQVEWTRQRAASALGRGVLLNAPTDAQRNAIRTLAASLVQLGDIQLNASKKRALRMARVGAGNPAPTTPAAERGGRSGSDAQPTRQHLQRRRRP